MKVIVLGKTGMLGSMVEKVLPLDGTFSVLGTQFENRDASGYFNVMDGIGALAAVCDELGGVDYFVNCIGLTANLMKDSNPKTLLRALKINSVFPQELAMFAANRNARVLHMSTDGVFGLNAQDAAEDHPHNCLDTYGKTKSLGEADAPNVLNIRTSIVGPSSVVGGGLFEWLRAQPDRSEVNGFTNHLWKGVTTKQFAEFCQFVIKDQLFDRLRSEGPAVHLVPNKALSKFEMLQTFAAALKKNITIHATESPGAALRTLRSTSSVLHELYPAEQDFADAVAEML